jgi:hypothetical protein
MWKVPLLEETESCDICEKLLPYEKYHCWKKRFGWCDIGGNLLESGKYHSIAPVKIIHLEGTTSGISGLGCATSAKILYHLEGTTSGIGALDHVEGTSSRRSALDRANLLPSGRYHLWKERSGPRHTRGNPFQ